MSIAEQEYRQGKKNLIIAVIASIPGPVALALSLGESTTQLADFLRRSCELLSIALSFGIFEISHRRAGCNQGEMEAIARLVTGSSMIFSGIAIGWLAVSNWGTARGSVATSLVLAILGALVNGRLYLGYRKLRHGVLNIQARLHWVKMLLDLWMTAVLLICSLSTGSVPVYADFIGSCSIAVYIIISGIHLLFPKEAPQ